MVGTYKPGDENLSGIRGGSMYGGIIYKGQSFFMGHNSEKRLHAVQNWIHDGNLKFVGGPSVVPYFQDMGYNSKMYFYQGVYDWKYLYY